MEDKDQLIAMSIPRLRLHVDEAFIVYGELMKVRHLTQVASFDGLRPNRSHSQYNSCVTGTW